MERSRSAFASPPGLTRRALLAGTSACLLSGGWPGLSATAAPVGCSIRPCNFGPVTSLVAARRSLQDILRLNLLPFWRGVADMSVGEGYGLNHDTGGRYLGPGNLSLISQARTAWFFARLIRLGLAEPADRARADRGYQVLAERFLDADYGGYYWELDWRTLQPSVPDKVLYGQCFPLMAMAEYALATGSAEAARLARQHFDMLDRHLWNAAADNHVEARYRDWSPLPPGAVDVRGQRSGVRTHNTRMHFMGAVSVHHELDPSPGVSRRLDRLVELIDGSIVYRPHPFFRERDGLRPTVQRYGHDMEAIQLLFQARARLDRCRTPPTAYGEIADGVLRFAVDQAGGIAQSGRVGVVATAFDRDDWVQAESLLALAELHRNRRRARRRAVPRPELDRPLAGRLGQGLLVRPHQRDWRAGWSQGRRLWRTVPYLPCRARLAADPRCDGPRPADGRLHDSLIAHSRIQVEP